MKKRIISLLGILVMLITVFNSPSFSTVDAKAETNPNITIYMNEGEFGIVRAYGSSNIENLQDAHTIVGFNSDVDFISLSRLTISVEYQEFAFFDIFKWNPIQKTFTGFVSSSDTTLFRIPNSTSWPLETFSNEALPMLGLVSDFLQYQLDGMNPTKKFLVDYPSGDLVLVQNSAIADYEYYVMIPIQKSIEAVFISVAGVTSEGNIYDGLDENGNPYTEDGLSYIVVNPFTTKSVYFTESAIIKKITINGLVTNDDVTFIVSNYDHVNDTWYEPSITHSFTENGDFSIYGLVAAKQLGLFVYDGVANFSIKLYYESEGYVVYTNVLGSDGKILPSFKEEDNIAPNILSDIKETLAFVVKVVGIVFGLTLFFVVLNGIIKFFTNVNRFSSSVKEKNSFKKSYKGRK